MYEIIDSLTIVGKSITCQQTEINSTDTHTHTKDLNEPATSYYIIDDYPHNLIINL